MMTLADGEDSFLNHEKLLWFMLQLASAFILSASSVTDSSKISGKDLLAAAGCRQILTPKTLPVAAAAAANVSGSPLSAANASSSPRPMLRALSLVSGALSCAGLSPHYPLSLFPLCNQPPAKVKYILFIETSGPVRNK